MMRRCRLFPLRRYSQSIIWAIFEIFDAARAFDYASRAFTRRQAFVVLLCFCTTYHIHHHMLSGLAVFVLNIRPGGALFTMLL